MGEHSNHRLRPLMLVGTGSDVGKSVLATAFCRIFRRRGYSPAPFKAQNMSLNSYVTPDGHEMGRAQCVQAEAAGVDCHSDMNPVLLKPNGDSHSQVILNGRVVGNRSAWDYYRGEGFPQLVEEAHAAYDRLSAQYNPIVLEGAGSVSELNLAKNDLANMPMAAYARAVTLLVADIERGGVFASLYGSLELMPREHRAQVKGIIVNKFRGDARLFLEGQRILERICHVPVLGVVPTFTDIFIEEEDSLALARYAKGSASTGEFLQVAVVHVEHMSNYTDFAYLSRYPGVHLYYTRDVEAIERADLLILPGCKNTVDALMRLKASGLADAILRVHAKGVGILGICGGYQMLGQRVEDPEHVEGQQASVEGLGLLPVVTRITQHKRVRRVSFNLVANGAEGEGYEVHMGRTELANQGSGTFPLTRLEDGELDGCVRGNVWGTYLHGLLDSQSVIQGLFSALVPEEKRGILRFNPSGDGAFDSSYRAFKERQYDRLADHIEEHVDVGQLIDILQRND